MHFLPDAKCLAAGGGRNRLMTLMRLGYRNAKQLKQATWDEENNNPHMGFEAWRYEKTSPFTALLGVTRY